MVQKHLYENLTWIEASRPNQEEIKALTKEYCLDLLVARDLSSPTPRPVLRSDKDSFYSVFHFPVSKQSHIEGNVQELDFVVLKHTTVTVRYDTIDAIEQFGKKMEVREAIDKNIDRESGDMLFFLIMNAMYESVGHELSYIDDTISHIEKEIFKQKEKEMVVSVSEVIRNLLNFRRVLHPHHALISSLRIIGEKIFGSGFTQRSYILEEELKALLKRIENQLELVTSLRETNDALLSTKQNEIMKILTIMAFVTFPLSLIAGIFGMNTSFIPIVGHSNDFWIVIGIMGGMTAAFFGYFKYKKWL
ncbi:MAG: CorA family divalent cation transporter [Candidatus Pacebacteria bacterium]|nr:CorA family divalent cation transporter [Candidatus Paceibacterota bacterium]